MEGSSSRSISSIEGRRSNILRRYLTSENIAMASVGTGLFGFYLFLRSFSNNWTRDVGNALFFSSVKRQVKRKLLLPEWSVVDAFEEMVRQDPNKTALIYISDDKEGEEPNSYTFREINQYANKVANWALQEGIVKGEVVALMMENSPEFMFTWLGLAKVGAISALINTNLRGASLKNNLKLATASRFIIDGIHIEVCSQAIRDELGGQWFITDDGDHGVPPGVRIVSGEVREASSLSPPSSARSGVGGMHDLFYIYTSGTTGMPKAARISHLRFYAAGVAFSQGLRVTRDDRVYSCLPAYHSSGMMATSVVFTVGSTLILRRKFSSSNFWKDCCEHNATVIHYIGELCRYLVMQSPSQWDTKHRVRLALGNGMRPDVWKPFQIRFKVPQIGEFYGSTEGNVTLINTQNKFCSVGFLSPVLTWFYPAFKIVRYDFEKEVPLRDSKTGFCIECRPKETGELISLIDNEDSLLNFKGYTNAQDTEDKILRNVFKKGDSWFRTGDLLYKNNDGFYFFQDRIGDTFRWKGENVATSEVEEVIGGIKGVVEVSVYGVDVPHHEGKAGMAALVTDSSFHPKLFYSEVKNNLAAFAIPVFLRVRREIDVTTTFKHKKSRLREEGFNPKLVSDPLYFRDDTKGEYVPLISHLYNDIIGNTINAKL